MARNMEKDREWRKRYNEEHKEEHSAYQKKYYLDNKIGLRIKHKRYADSGAFDKVGYGKKYREKNRDKLTKQMRDSRLLKNYGISDSEYNKMFDQQNGVCAICGKPETVLEPKTRNIGKLVVDHDHETGRVRGLLCRKCNLGLGALGDSREIVVNALKYLEKPIIGA